MTVARMDASVAFLGEKVYVMGGCGSDESANLFEVFDIKTQSWRSLWIPDNELRGYCKFIGDKGKLYVVAETIDYTYEPKEGTWEVVREESSRYIGVWCIIENVMYGFNYYAYIMWFDSERREWKVIKGLEELRGSKAGCVLEIVNYGGNLLVMWNLSYSISGVKRNNKIWYAETSLETRCNGSEVWGKVEWVDAMLTVPREKYEYLHCLTVSV